ncbi:MAG: hypothetical protein HZA62_04030 [Rhodocyclales bacterium]|nr:hypothetical protein [Rhodocyclales bacterium]
MQCKYCKDPGRGLYRKRHQLPSEQPACAVNAAIEVAHATRLIATQSHRRKCLIQCQQICLNCGRRFHLIIGSRGNAPAIRPCTKQRLIKGNPQCKRFLHPSGNGDYQQAGQRRRLQRQSECKDKRQRGQRKAPHVDAAPESKAARGHAGASCGLVPVD